MKQPASLYRLSPNEAARLVQEERENRRKLRLIQVREQAKVNAARIRQSVKAEKKKQINLLAQQVQEDWEKEKSEKLRQLEEVYVENLKNIGEGHRDAVDKDIKKEAEDREILQQENQRRATMRHQRALKKEAHDRAQQEEEATRHIMARQSALEIEKFRAADVAARPPPPKDPIAEVAPIKVRPVQFTDANAFSTTHFHAPTHCHVEKATEGEQLDARGLAEEEQLRLDTWQEEQARSLREQAVKARLRHKQALEKEMLKHDYEAMLHDLSDLQREATHRRQQVVATIPKQIFIPPHRRIEEKADEQRNMEQAFEDMYLQATDFAGDLSLALDPHPPPETPTTSDALDLSVLSPEHGDQSEETIPTSAEDMIAPPHPVQMPSIPSALKDVTNITKSKKTPDSGLKKLLGRIQTQRNDWAHRSSQTTSELPQQGAPQPGDQGKPSGAVPPQADAAGAWQTDQGVQHTQDGETLLHPMEQAARVRQKPNDESNNLSAFFAGERDRHEKMKEENEAMKAEVCQHQEQLQEQMREMERKIREIESRKKQLEDERQLPTSDINTQPSPLSEVPSPQSGMHHSGMMPGQRVSPDRSGVMMHGGSPGRLSTLTDGSGQYITDQTPASSMFSMSDESGTVGRKGVSLDKVKQYQEQLLQRAEMMRSATQNQGDIATRTEDLLAEYNIWKQRQQADLLANGSLSWQQPQFPGSHNGSLETRDVAMTTAAAEVRMPPSYGEVSTAADVVAATQLPGGTMQPGGTGVFHWASELSQAASRDQQRYEQQAAEQKAEFDTRQLELQQQLEEIQRQKQEIHSRQEQHKMEMQELREKWRRELTHYRQTEELMTQYMTSPNTSPAAAQQALDSSGNGAVASPGHTPLTEQNSPGTGGISSSEIEDPLSGLEAEFRPLATQNLSEQLAAFRFSASEQESEVATPQHTRPPTGRLVGQYLTPHELSTIQEMDTPMSDRGGTGRFSLGRTLDAPLHEVSEEDSTSETPSTQDTVQQFYQDQPAQATLESRPKSTIEHLGPRLAELYEEFQKRQGDQELSSLGTAFESEGGDYIAGFANMPADHRPAAFQIETDVKKIQQMSVPPGDSGFHSEPLGKLSAALEHFHKVAGSPVETYPTGTNEMPLGHMHTTSQFSALPSSVHSPSLGQSKRTTWHSLLSDCSASSSSSPRDAANLTDVDHKSYEARIAAALEEAKASSEWDKKFSELFGELATPAPGSTVAGEKFFPLSPYDSPDQAFNNDGSSPKAYHRLSSTPSRPKLSDEQRSQLYPPSEPHGANLTTHSHDPSSGKSDTTVHTFDTFDHTSYNSLRIPFKTDKFVTDTPGELTGAALSILQRPSMGSVSSQLISPSSQLSQHPMDGSRQSAVSQQLSQHTLNGSQPSSHISQHPIDMTHQSEHSKEIYQHSLDMLEQSRDLTQYPIDVTGPSVQSSGSEPSQHPIDDSPGSSPVINPTSTTLSQSHKFVGPSLSHPPLSTSSLSHHASPAVLTSQATPSQLYAHGLMTSTPMVSDIPTSTAPNPQDLRSHYISAASQFQRDQLATHIPHKPPASAPGEMHWDISDIHSHRDTGNFSTPHSGPKLNQSQELLNFSKTIAESADEVMSKHEALVQETKEIRRQFSNSGADANPVSPTKRLDQMTSGCTGITDEPDLTLVSLESSQAPSLTEVTPDKHGSSLQSFEGHEHSLTTDSEYSFLHSSPKKKNVKKSEPSNSNNNSPKRLSWDPQLKQSIDDVVENTLVGQSMFEGSAGRHHPIGASAVSSAGLTVSTSAVSSAGITGGTSTLTSRAPHGHMVVTIPHSGDAETSGLSESTLSPDQSALLSTVVPSQRVAPGNSNRSPDAAMLSESDISEDLSRLRRALETTTDENPDDSGDMPGTSDLSSVFGSETSDGSQCMSLQQAFMRKKKGFIASAAGRREQAKAEMLAKVKVAAPKLEPAPSYSSLSQTLASWKKSRALNATNKADKASARAPSTEMVNRTQADRKKEETHNKARTERLYSRLEEVQKRKVELDRKEQYTKNREKAKEFEQKQQERRRKMLSAKKAKKT